MSNFAKPAALFALVLSAIALYPEVKSAADSNQVNGSHFRVVRSLCGSSGAQRGDRFVIDDRRSVFYVPKDRQVVVYLELEGPAGNHHIEGFWKNPAGNLASLSDFSYTSGEKIFSSHFTLALLESAAAGIWRLEVHIDGEFVAEIKFEIAASSRPNASNLSNKLLSPAEIYQRAAASTVTIDRIGKNRELLGASTGFVAGPGIVVTAIETIDGAAKLRVILPSGRQQETDRILSWNRKKGYSVIGVDIDRMPELPFAQSNSWQIGDEETFLEVTPEGSRVISEVKIVGGAHLSEGDRINLTGSATEKARGGALLNDYGEVIGIVDSPIYSWVVSSRTSDIIRLASEPANSRGMAIPIDGEIIKQTSPSTLEKLASTGEVLAPVGNGGHVLLGQLFSRSNGRLGVLVTWDPKEKLKGVANLLVCDKENKVLGPSDKRSGKKVNFRPGQQTLTSWDFDVSHLPAGIYRIDVQIDGIPYWRTFFQIQSK